PNVQETPINQRTVKQQSPFIIPILCSPRRIETRLKPPKLCLCTLHTQIMRNKDIPTARAHQLHCHGPIVLPHHPERVLVRSVCKRDTCIPRVCETNESSRVAGHGYLERSVDGVTDRTE